MAKTQTYSMEKILAVREVLRNLPVKEKEKSRNEVAEFLKSDLRKAVKQGHSLKEIQAILVEHGISVQLSNMEAVLGQSGKGAVREKTGKSPAESLTAMPKDIQAGNESRAALVAVGRDGELEKTLNDANLHKEVSHAVS